MADAAFNNDLLTHDAQRLALLMAHFQYARNELSKTGVTQQLLWQEYIEQHLDGYVYSHYCYHLNQYLKNQDLSMHLEFQAADTIMVDFAGKSNTTLTFPPENA